MDRIEAIVEIPFKRKKTYGFEIITFEELRKLPIPRDQHPSRPHRLKFYLLLFITKGQGQHFIDFKSFHFGPGSCIFVAKDQVHAFDLRPDVEGFLVLFTDTFLDKTMIGTQPLKSISLYNYQVFNSPILQIPSEAQSQLLEQIHNINREYQQEDFATIEIIKAELKILLFRLERIRKNTNLPAQKKTISADFFQFQQFLNQHLFDSRKVGFYAFKMNVSTKKLNRVIHKATGLSAKNYIDQMLILESKRLLVNTNMSIKEISYIIGFDEPTNFIKYFKKFSRLTPTTFRKQF